ncbi:MAG: transglutaminase family protein [Propionibacteriaceae bacterium]|jgi:transglutaminase-like putative cysteine protease|nr:transglutaminase family protein [Propionibacteriaceae bacterium]
MRRFQITHLSRYRYDDEVEHCYNRAYLTPRETAYQHVLSHQITGTPPLAYTSTHEDPFGNTVTYLEFPGGTQAITVRSECLVEVCGNGGHPTPAGLSEIERAEFTLPSPLVQLDGGIRAYAAEIFTPGRALPDALQALLDAIDRDFHYRTGITHVNTEIKDVLDTRVGVCQDFAHLSVGILRAAGLPARYVSGYIETSPPPGKPKLRGADATHAWASVYTEAGWLDFDPTNHQLVDDRYITLAWGRDFTDVSPLRGVVFTESETSHLSVAVDVIPA